MASSTIEIYNKDEVLTYQGPSGWNELTRDQLLFWCGVIRQELTLDEALLMACVNFYKIPRKVYLPLPEVVDLNLAWRMEWLTDNKLTNNVIGKFSIFFRSYYGPANRLANLTIGEYRRTELFYDLYLRTGLKKYLHLLCAVLFRPKGKGAVDDVRCELIESEVMKRAEWFRRYLHPNYIKAIQIQYEGCRNYIRASFPLVYPPPPEQDEAPNPFAPKQNTGIQDLEDHILAFSGDKLGNYALTEKTNLYLFMKYMSQRIEEYNSKK